MNVTILFGMRELTWKGIFNIFVVLITVVETAENQAQANVERLSQED